MLHGNDAPTRRRPPLLCSQCRLSRRCAPGAPQAHPPAPAAALKPTHMPHPNWRQPPLSQLDTHVLSAAGAGRLDLLDTVLASGGSANAGPDFCSDSPLLLAARGGHTECCLRLLGAGADASWQGSRGETAAMVAIMSGNEALLEALLAAHPGAELGARSDGGLTAFHLACLHRRPDALARLLTHQQAQLDGTAPAHAPAFAPATPTAAAAGGGGAGGASVDTAVATSERGATAAERRRVAGRQLVLAIYASVGANEPRCLQLLVQSPLAREAYAAQFSASAGGGGGGGAQLVQQGRAQRRDRAAEERLQEDLSFLLDGEVVGPHNCRPATFLWQTNGMPSHLAAALNQPDCLHILLSSGFCPVDEPTAEGFTPLMLAAAADAAAAAVVLLQAGAAMEARNTASRTPLFLAAVGGSAQALGVLLRAGADVFAVEDTRGCPPLMGAIGRAAAMGSSAFQGQPRTESLLHCAELLLGAGADVNQAAKDGSTALHAAAEGGSLPALELLLAHGADAEVEDIAKRTPLARAAAAGMARHRECIMLLLARGVTVGHSDAPRVLDCLLRSGSDGGSIVTAWHVLAILTAPQLKSISACPAFYDLPHTEGPQRALPAAAVDAMLEVAAEGCSNLLYNVSPTQNASQGRRPAHLFELLTRTTTCCTPPHTQPSAAAAGAGEGGGMTRTRTCHPVPHTPVHTVPSAAIAAGEEDGSEERAAPCLRQLVAGSPHVAKMLANWASVQMLLQYASCIARCRGVPQPDREQLSLRVGHLFSAYHSLGASLCSALHLSLSAGMEHPHAPLAASSAACLGRPPAPPTPVATPQSPAPAAACEVAPGGLGVDTTRGEAVGDPAGPEPAAAVQEEGHDAEHGEVQDFEPLGLEEPTADDKIMAEEEAAAGDADVLMMAVAEEEHLSVLASASPADNPAAAAEHASLAMPGVPSAAPAPEAAVSAPSPAAGGGVRGPREERAIAAALRPFADTIDDMVACISDQAQMRAWHWLLEYREVVGLACKQRLLQSIISAWPRRSDSQLLLNTGRAAVLQRVCCEVERRQAGSAASEAGNHSVGSVAGSMGGALWHGLKVAFEQEHGVGDGVRREWFRLLAAELTNPDVGLFESHDGGATFSPAPHADVQCDEQRDVQGDEANSIGAGGGEGVGAGGGHLQKFELVGCLAGVGIMQGCTLPGFSLTSATWRAVLGQPPAPAADLAASDPLLHRSLQLLGSMGAEVADLGLFFEVQDALGRRAELCPAGANVAVTAGNLERYLVLLARHKSVDSLAAESAALAKGLCAVLTRGVVDVLSRCFGHAELNAMLAGVADVEMPDWQAHARYEQCGPATDQVTWLWDTLEAAPQLVRRQLLSFVTGSASLPAGGFAALRGFNGAQHPFTVCLVAAEGDDRLPRASTCFNTFFLPRYSSAAVLEARITQAITGEQCFDEGVIRR